MWNLTKTFLAPEDSNVIIKVDPVWGFSEFPQPGDSKKHSLPVLIDYELLTTDIPNSEADYHKNKHSDAAQTQFWMPDRYCKVCYGCEEAFTMYRRRHHCRMCGQIFCNNCSSFYIDGMMFNTPGLVRACRLCYDQQFERTESENRLARRKLLDKAENNADSQLLAAAARNQALLAQSVNKSHEVQQDLHNVGVNLQNRASAHFNAIVERLVANSAIIKNREMWREAIQSLVREVVSSVDPDVRGGDGMDIRQYVKIKIIPGGSMEESTFVDGVVFRKNVSHKKMAKSGTKTNPRILLLAGGIEFQRTDTKLSSMDTLIEQEDKYMEILVEKIMSLKPDIILVGKAVARKAQELLCEHKVVVMQNVKPQLLERIGRMTGAMLLPSTDHMIKQFGEECLGTCGEFRLRVVQDDPEKADNSHAAPRILRTRISRGSTYAYVTGCPSERGCTILLRGDTRDVLSDVKRIIEFSMVTAYHLRLEVSYYKDRYADLPPPESAEDWEEDGSDVDDVITDIARDDLIAAAAAIASGAEPVKKKIRYGDVRARRERYYYSSSLDVDISLPYNRELVGTQLFHHHSKPHNVTLSSAEQHQTLLITSLLMSENNGTPTQKASAEVKGIKYYTKQDIALGQFIVDNCFQLGRFANRGESRMLEQTLSFIHRPGRIDISVHRNESNPSADADSTTQRDPFRIPIFMTSFCKECRKHVTPLTMMSDETWKMSFGKFLEMFFYNRTAVCKVGGCSHQIRDNHTLAFQCEGYVAMFDFIPQHAFALHVREGMSFPDDFHNQHTAVILKNLPSKHLTLMEDFKMAVVVLEREIREMLSNRPDDLALAMADITLMEAEISAFSNKFAEELLMTYSHLPKKFQEVDIEAMLKSQLSEKMCNVSYRSSSRLQPLQDTMQDVEEAARLTEIPDDAATAVEAQADLVTASVIPPEIDTSVGTVPGDERISVATAVGPAAPSVAPDSPQNKLRLMSSASVAPTVVPSSTIGANYNVEVALRFPMHHMRDTFIKTSVWNHRIDTIYKFLEAVRHLVIHQQQLQSQNPGSAVTSDIATFEDEYWETRRPLENMHAQYSRKQQQQQHQHLVATTAHHPNQQHHHPSFTGQSNVPYLDPMTPITPMDDLNNFIGLPTPPVRDASDSLHQAPHPMASVDSMAPSVMLGPSVSVATTTPASMAAASAMPSKGVAFVEQQQQSKKASDKPVDKVSRFTKLVKNLVLGNKDTSENEHGKFLVPIGDFGEGRYGLPPGRRGEVIPVHEDEFATIIAYSLASSEYHDDLQLSIKEDHVDTSEADNEEEEERGAPSSGKSSAATASIHSMKSNISVSNKSSSKAQQKEKEQEEDNEDGDDDFGGGGSGKEKSGGGGNGTETSELERAFAKAENSTAMLGTSANLFSAGGDVIFTKEEGAADGVGGASGKGGAAGGPRAADGLSDDDLASDGAAASAAEPAPFRPAVKKSVNEKQMISQNKSYIRHRFNDLDEDGNVACKFQCQTYWAKQFEAVRSCYFNEDNNENFIRSLSMSSRWSAQGGKSGAAFSKSMDDRLVIKVISRVELQMFLEFAPAYFEYMAKNYYHSLPTVLCKILGVYTVRFHNKESGKKVVENVVVMENIFYQRNITRTFDLKGSSRARYVELAGQKLDDFDEALLKRRKARKAQKNGEGGSKSVESQKVSQVLLDDNLMELTKGRPFPLKHRAKLFFHKAVLNDTLFLSIVNVVDYSILVGFDETNNELVVGIIDYLRQYDIIKKMERMGKSVGMLTGQAAPTIIQPSQYRKRFSLAMERYFMTVPDKWVSHDA